MIKELFGTLSQKRRQETLQAARDYEGMVNEAVADNLGTGDASRVDAVLKRHGRTTHEFHRDIQSRHEMQKLEAVAAEEPELRAQYRAALDKRAKLIADGEQNRLDQLASISEIHRISDKIKRARTAKHTLADVQSEMAVRMEGPFNELKESTVTSIAGVPAIVRAY